MGGPREACVVAAGGRGASGPEVDSACIRRRPFRGLSRALRLREGVTSGMI